MSLNSNSLNSGSINQGSTDMGTIWYLLTQRSYPNVNVNQFNKQVDRDKQLKRLVDIFKRLSDQDDEQEYDKIYDKDKLITIKVAINDTQHRFDGVMTVDAPEQKMSLLSINTIEPHTTVLAKNIRVEMVK